MQSIGAFYVRRCILQYPMILSEDIEQIVQMNMLIGSLLPEYSYDLSGTDTL